jgi:trehalose 6-phosphate synthase
VRLSLRFIVPLVLVLAALAYGVTPLVDQLTLRWFIRDLDIRSNLVANTVQDPLEDLVQAGNRARIGQFFTRMTRDERLLAMAFCPGADEKPIQTAALPPEIHCAELEPYSSSSGKLLNTAKGPVLITVRPLVTQATPDGKLVLVHDMSFIARRSAETRQYLFYFFATLGLIVSFITVVIAQLSWRGWVQGLRSLVRGEGLLKPTAKPDAPELQPVASDLRALIRDLEAEYRSRDDEKMNWSPETLRTILDHELRGQELIVVSNREPYIHVRRDSGIQVQRPASGVVTALEPVMRACSGTWIAHGSGSADRDVVDLHDRVGVPEEHPLYRLRRVWLSEPEEVGYYYGFANEGLWPLCHIAHVRPTFRSSDWENYHKVNRRFARAVVKESGSPTPIVLVQDYHFALLPRMIRELLPEAIVITFWHIPWPNAEAFSICPWREELVDGLLGSSVLGFQTQFHCNNFFDTVDRLLEARIDRDAFTVSYRGKVTAVKRYPISVQWPPAFPLPGETVEQSDAAVRERHDLPTTHAIAVGVDRLDYTKGIEERFAAVERLLEMHPEWVGRLTFIQIAAPTREIIPRYREYETRVMEMAAAINRKYSGSRHPAIILRAEHLETPEIYQYYRAADVCMVSSLHDGMNLVAKEFVSAREDERGVLILSQFAGAARELPEAIIINPYDVDECAEALHVALKMPPREQRTRMRLMRGLVREFNVYRWAGRMLMDASALRRRGRLSEPNLARPAVATEYAHAGEG